MPFPHHPRQQSLKSLVDAVNIPFWLDDPRRPEPASPLATTITTDLAIIGAGFTGLWTALLAKEADPAREVVLLEAEETACGASGRNGGFIAASLTHGFMNGLKHWPNELATLTAMGQANLEAIGDSISRLGIDCDFQRSGELLVATEPYQVEELSCIPDVAAPYGEQLVWFDQEQTRSMVNSPLYLGGLFNQMGVAMANPAQLAWGLRGACLHQGVRIYEQTPVLSVKADHLKIQLQTPNGYVQARKTAIATNAFPPLLKRISRYIVPVYDYVLVSEPLSPAQKASIGWQERQGLSDSNNQFHYYRMTADDRILWGGYDAVYHWNNGVGKHLETNHEVFGRLAEHFFITFPSLEGLHFTHAWGGVIDTCSRFCPFWGTAYGGQTAYVVGFTGLGVGSSRFGAQVMLDLLEGKSTERTKLGMVRTRPVPFPQEPFRSLVINFTRRSLLRADEKGGSRNLWLQLLDKLGLGFDS